MNNMMSGIKLYFLLFLAIFVLSACLGDITEFQAGDIKDDFCGTHINYQYCKCAFHNEFCEQIAMNKSEAKKYVNEEYDKWVEKEKLNFASQCQLDNGIYSDKGCKYCDDDKVVAGDKCEKIDKVDEEDSNVDEDVIEGECKYDSDCDAICEGDTMWKMGCNPRNNTCEKTFDTDCKTNMETFGEMSFSMICKSGECSRDENKIRSERNDLETLKKKYSDELKTLNATRDNLKNVMLDANKNCLNSIADMTNLAIVEFATRVSSILDGGIPDFASASVDYVGDALNKLYAYQGSNTPTEEKKLKPDEYIKLNCGLYDYFKVELKNSDKEVDELVEGAKKADEKLKVLPVL